MTYFIRPFAELLPEHFQEPRRPDTVRRSLDGVLCVVAFDKGTEPAGWDGGMEREQVSALLSAAESERVWWEAIGV